MQASSFPVEQALLLFEVDKRRTEVGRSVTKALADVYPRLADIAIHGGPLLSGETRQWLIAEVVRILRPLPWARPEMAVAAVMRPFGRFDEVAGCWMLHFSESDAAFALMGEGYNIEERLKIERDPVQRDALYRSDSALTARRKGMLRSEAREHWQRFLDEVQTAWDAAAQEVHS